MKHYGDITKINGFEIEPVDVVTGGSPCQDLSVAGRRAGLDGERSGLFMEQIRIIKEMRERDRRNGISDELCRPRFVVWENVPGAFSSNKGRDFQAVLTEFVRVAEPAAPDVPMPPKRWDKSGCLYDELGRWSIAWRVHDAQFWGVPQRRKRIALVADFGGLSASEVLFERKGLPRDTEKGEEQKQGAARSSEGGVNYTVYNGENITSPTNKANPQPGDPCHTLDRDSRNYVVCLQGNGIDRADTAGCNGRGWNDEGVSYTLNTIDRPAVFDARGNGDGKTVPTLTGDHQNRGTDYTAITYQKITGPLMANSHPGSYCGQDAYNDLFVAPTYGLDRASFNQGQNAKYNFSIEEEKIGAQTARGPGAVFNGMVRRLTPLECERLQGFPDGWTDIGEWTDNKGKKRQTTDSARYKALGNSIALPFWKVLARRISAQYDRDITMGSLFDGIGGFPLAFQHCGGRAVWASEIEEFPIAVTKLRFP